MSDEKTMTHEAIFHRLIASSFPKRAQGYIMDCYREAEKLRAKHEEEQRAKSIGPYNRSEA